MQYKTNFYLDRRKDEKGKQQTNDIRIRLSFNFGNERFGTSTGLKANLNQWNDKTQRFKNSATNNIEKNKTLDDIADRLEGIYLKILNSGSVVTPQAIKEVYQSKGNVKTFFEYYNEFTQTEGTLNAWSLSTYQKFKTLKIHLQNFEKAEALTLNFSMVNRDFYQKLFMYFAGIGHRNSTIKKTFKNVNWFFAWCMKSKKIALPGFKDFEIKDKTQSTQGKHENIVFLRPDEFLKMYEANIPDLRLSRVKDIFSFMCATGLRYSDFDGLTKDSFSNGVLKLTTQKTADPLEIPLNPFALAILEKYSYSLPKISNPKLNLYVKDLAEVLEFNRTVTKVYIKNGETVRETSTLAKVITTHCARKTFISLSVFLDMNTEILMRFSGHKSHEMLEVYTGFTDQQKRSEMDKFSPENLKKRIAN